MTTIVSASYSASRYTGQDRTASSNSSNSYDELLQKQDKSEPSSSSAAVVDSRPSASISIFKVRLGLDWEKAKINVSELPEDKYQTFIEQDQQRIAANKQFLESQYTQTEYPDSTNDARTQSYATVSVGGTVVATIDNQGIVESDDVLGAKLRDILSGDVNGTNGPNLAQARAEQIAKLLGGKIVKSSSAMTQSGYNALPAAAQPKVTIDYASMKNDPLYDQIQTMSANLESTKLKRAEFLARQ